MRKVKLTEETKKGLLEDLLKRSPNHYGEYEGIVADIIAKIREEGDKALFSYTKQFDRCEITAATIRVTKEEIQEAYMAMEPEFVEVMKKAAANIREYHEKQVRNSWIDVKEDGSILGQKITPIARAGVYVPGGKAAYPSSVLMNVIPAKTAGVSEIIMLTPPGADGKVNPGTLVAADIAAKTAIVKLIELRLAKGMSGKSYLFITGEVAAVTAAIEKARDAIKDEGMYLDSAVIPRPDKNLWKSIL